GLIREPGAGVSPAQHALALERENKSAVAIARRGKRDACPTLAIARFLVALHAKKRKGARHDPGTCLRLGRRFLTLNPDLNPDLNPNLDPNLDLNPNLKRRAESKITSKS